MKRNGGFTRGFCVETAGVLRNESMGAAASTSPRIDRRFLESPEITSCP